MFFFRIEILVFLLVSERNQLQSVYFDPLLLQARCFSWESTPFAIAKVTNQTFQVNVRKTTKEAKCAICKKTTTPGDLQAGTEGAYRPIHRTWILSTFFFCPSMSCMTKMPRNSFIIPFSPSQMTLHLDPDLTQEERLSVGILWFNTTCTSWDIVCYSS